MMMNVLQTHVQLEPPARIPLVLMNAFAHWANSQVLLENANVLLSYNLQLALFHIFIIVADVYCTKQQYCQTVDHSHCAGVNETSYLCQCRMGYVGDSLVSCIRTFSLHNLILNLFLCTNSLGLQMKKFARSNQTCAKKMKYVLTLSTAIDVSVNQDLLKMHQVNVWMITNAIDHLHAHLVATALTLLVVTSAIAQKGTDWQKILAKVSCRSFLTHVRYH